MLRLAFLFPGQGSQYPGMGKEIAGTYPEAAGIFHQADEILGCKLSEICFEGPAEVLNQTEYAQPALLTCSLATLEVVKTVGLEAEMLAGLSLGEYTALVAAGALTFEDTLPLVQFRGRLMQEAVPPGKGAMAAVLGLDAEKVDEICAQTEGYVAVANYNCPAQLVISGEKEAVDKAGARLKDAGARVVPLAVSVPSHCQLMYDASIQLKSRLDKLNWREPEKPVVSNVNARENPAGAAAELLVRQLYSPVRWEQSVRYMLNRVDYFVEIGPGSSLSGLVKRIDRDRILGHVEDLKTLEKVKEKVEKLCRDKQQ